MQTEATATEWIMPISETLSLRIYADSRPHRQLTTRLQKGLILVSHGKELVGEGIGLGVPAVRYRDRTYFPGSSAVKVERTRTYTTAIKKFDLNLNAERTLRNIQVETETIRTLRRSIDRLYKKHKRFRLLMIENLLRRTGIKTDFVQTKPIGSAVVTYRITQPYIRVRAEFKLPKRSGLQKTYLLNEQGSKCFRKYCDSSGKVLFDKDIGAWETVDADWACIQNIEDNVGFRLWKLKEATLYRGREFLKNIFDWSGLDYEVDPSNVCLEYNIELIRRQLKK